ncbi:MAG: septum formation initiator family protein [Bacteroidales bacterium]|nr:septum formation initiator family protein [Bacteroidales bacterium]
MKFNPKEKIRTWIETKKAEKRLWRIVLNKYFIASFIFVIWLLFFDNNNVFVWLRTQSKLRDQQARIEYLQEQIEDTSERLGRLRSDRDTLETFAREQYLFHTAEEDVYLIDD